MKAAVTDLYAVILRFLIRARDWYEEGKLKHFVHSITRPVELRYQDLLDQITDSTRVIEDLARVGHQAESRDMHTNMQIKLHQVHADVQNKVDQAVADLHRKIDSTSNDIHNRLALMNTTVEMIHNTVTCK